MAFVVLFAILLVLIVVPIAAVTAARAVGRSMDEGRSGRGLPDPMIDDRLLRIEEAIDAMATQIEALTQQQRQLLGANEPARASDEEGGDRRLD